MQKPRKFLTRMGLFLILGLIVVAVLKDPVRAAFMANPALNGVILAVLVLGILYALRRVTDLAREVAWCVAFRRQEVASSETPPRLMAPAAALLTKTAEGSMQLSAFSMRSVLDGIASRLEESREISRYMTGLLIFLGLLGTFWGLLGTIGSIGSTINGLTIDSADMALMFDELKAGLEAPLAGMGTAFSSSLFGLAGSLVLGFMDLQASQAQTRFYNDVEDWLAGVTHLSRGGEETGGMAVAGPSGYMTALMEQSADSIDKLTRTMAQMDDGRAQMQTSLAAFSAALDGLGEQLGESRRASEASKDAIVKAAEKLAASAGGETGLDEATRNHIRNMDSGIRQMIEAQSHSTDQIVDELRAELKFLARTMAASVDNAMMASGKKPAETSHPSGKGEAHSEDEHPLMKLGGAKRDEDES